MPYQNTESIDIKTGKASPALPEAVGHVPAHPKGSLASSMGIIVLLALVWGSSFILMKRGLTFFSAPEVAALRISSAGLFMLPLALARWRDIKRAALPYMLASGIIGSFVPAFLFATAGKYLDSGISGSLNGLSPLFTLVVGIAFYKSKTSWQGYAGILVGLAGALALSLVRVGGGAELNLWALLVVLATFLYAVNINLVKNHLAGTHPVTITAVALVPIGLLAASILFFGTEFVSKVGQPGFWGVPLLCSLTLGVFGSALSIILYNRLLKQISAVMASTVTYLMPVVSLCWGVWDGEQIQLWQIVGLVLVLAGMGLVGWASYTKKK